jgi:uncharacterized membrane protein
MSDLVVIAFPDEATAFALRAELVKLQKEYLIEMEDVVVVTKDDKGDVKLHQAVNLTTGGAVGGTLWGALIGLLFLNPLVGAAVGAGAGALAGRLSDIGIDDEFLRDVGAALRPEGSALCVLVRKMTAAKVLDRLSAFRHTGKIIQTSFAPEVDDKLRAFIERRDAVTMTADQLGGGRS